MRLNPLPQDDAWLARRMEVVGASEIAAIMDLNPYQTARMVYDAKLGATIEQNDAMILGNWLELPVAQLWAENKGVQLTKGEFVRHPTIPHLGATPDYITDEKPPRIVEIKVVGPRAWAFHWKGGFEIPVWIELQVQQQMACAGIDRATIVALATGSKVEEFDLVRDEATILRIEHASELFWREHVSARKPPPPGPTKAETDELNQRYPQPEEPAPPLVLGREGSAKVEEYLHCREMMKFYEKRQAEAGNWLREFLGEAEADTAETADGATVTWKANRVLDTEALRANLTDEQVALYSRLVFNIADLEREIGSEAIDKFRTPGTTRVLNVKTVKR